MNIMKYRNLFFGISLLVLIPSVFSLIFNGVKTSIDFVGGSRLEVRINTDAVGADDLAGADVVVADEVVADNVFIIF